MGRNDGVSISVIKRLPRYYRFLGELKENGAVGRLATSEEMAEPIVFLNSNMARFMSGELMIIDMGHNCEVVLGYAKNRLNVPVALKIYNTKFMQDMLKKQI